MGDPADHDLLIRIDERVGQIVKRLDGYVPCKCIEHSKQIEELESNAKQRSAREWAVIIVGLGAVVSFVLTLIIGWIH